MSSDHIDTEVTRTKLTLKKIVKTAPDPSYDPNFIPTHDQPPTSQVDLPDAVSIAQEKKILDSIWLLKAQYLELQSAFQLQQYDSVFYAVSKTREKIKEFDLLLGGKASQVLIIQRMQESIQEIEIESLGQISDLWHIMVSYKENDELIILKTKKRSTEEEDEITLEEVEELLKIHNAEKHHKELQKLRSYVDNILKGIVELEISVTASTDNIFSLKPQKSQINSLSDFANSVRIFLTFINKAFTPGIFGFIKNQTQTNFIFQIRSKSLPQLLNSSFESSLNSFDLQPLKQLSTFLNKVGWSRYDVDDWIDNIEKEFLEFRKIKYFNTLRQDLILASHQKEYILRKLVLVEGKSKNNEGPSTLTANSNSDGVIQSSHSTKRSKDDPQNLKDDYDDIEEDDAWNMDDDVDIDSDDQSEKKASSANEEDSWNMDEDNFNSDDQSDKKENNSEGEEEEDAWGWDDPDLNLKTPKTPFFEKKTEIQHNHPSNSTQLASVATFHSTFISEKVLDLIFEFLNEGDSIQQHSIPIIPELRNVGKLYGEALPEFYELYFSMIPLLYTDTDNWLVYNDLLYIYQETSLSPRITDISLDAILQKQISAKLISILSNYKTTLKYKWSQMHSFTGCTDESIFTKYDDIITNIHLFLTKLNNISNISVVNLDKMVAMLFEFFYNLVLNEILAFGDVSTKESEILSKWVDKLLEIVSLNPQLSVISSKNLDFNTIVPSFHKLLTVKKILNLHLKEILTMFYNGELFDLETAELIKLIKALFADSSARSETISEIEEVRAEVL